MGYWLFSRHIPRVHVGLEMMLAIKFSGTVFVCIGQGPQYRVPAVTLAGGLGEIILIVD